MDKETGQLVEQRREALFARWKNHRLGKKYPQVIAAMQAVDRALFISPDLLLQAWDDNPLEIGYGQTISQPTTVFYMLCQLDVRPGHRVVEVGGGCGYQAAILAELATASGRVVSYEIVEPLAHLARSNLERAGYGQVEVIAADIELQRPAPGSVDRLVAACACPEVPSGWLETLSEGGVLLAPVGQPSQQMQRWVRHKDRFKHETSGQFRFVPLRGLAGS